MSVIAKSLSCSSRRPHALLMMLAMGLCGAACAADEADTGEALVELAPPAEGAGFQLKFEATAPAGTEIWLCEIGVFPGTTASYVGSVESKQTEGVHHMDIMALAFTGISLEPGMYECDELYDTYPSLMEDGIFLYASQAAEQLLTLPEGTAAVIPPKLTIMHEMHYVNTTPQDKTVESLVNVYLTDQEATKNTIWGNAVRDVNLTIPPMSKHTEWTRCVMSEDIDLLFLSSHTHELGKEVRVSHFDGTNVEPEPFYVNTDWATPFLQNYADAPLHIKKGTGFEFQCDFDNPRDEEVHWGFGAQDEMCQIALVYSPGDANIVCDVVDSSDGILE